MFRLSICLPTRGSGAPPLQGRQPNGEAMKRSPIRSDTSYLISALLLAAALVTLCTGLIADLWGLNDFAYHNYAGYATAALGLAHVCLHWGRLAAYARLRLGRKAEGRVPGSDEPPAGRPHPDGEQERECRSPGLDKARRALVSRRGFIGLALGALGGFAVGRGLRSPPELPYGADLGVIYHEWSKPGLLSLLGTVADWGRQPPLYKEYSSSPQVALPSPGPFQGLDTEEAIRARRSVRDYSDQPITLEELSRLLHLTAGITAERWGHALRAAPSAGALYPIEVYPVVHHVENLEGGLYHYNVRDHALELLRAGDLRGEITRHGLMQEFLGQANLALVLTAIFQRLRWKYQERTYRYALLEAGHLGQNAYLAATSMGMGACAVGAFLDENLNALLGVDGQDEAVVYLLAIGAV
jgi:SagB-type dehydrogenase family enzyme